MTKIIFLFLTRESKTGELRYKMKIKKYIFILIILFLSFSCDTAKQANDFTEGEITYEISYLQNNLENIETSLLPKKMTLTFNSNYSLTKIDGFMGLFSISLISEFNNSKDITMVKFFDNKYVHYCDKNEVSSIFEYMNIKNIKTNNQTTSDYLGFDAKTAQVFEKGLEPYNIYFTDEIGVSDPNRNNPFRDINGVLLEFQLQLLQLRMNLTAKKVEQKTVTNDVFTVPDEYTTVSRESIILILNKMLETS